MFTDRNNAAGNAIASVRPPVRLFLLYLRNQLTVECVDLEWVISIAHRRLKVKVIQFRLM